MQNIKAIIFDCFGVLYLDASEAYFSKFSEKYEELHDLDKMSNHGFIERYDYIHAVSKITGEPINEVKKAFQKEHTINKPLIELIRSEIKPRFKVALLSNIGRDWLQDFFNEHQLHGLFDVVVLSSDEGITKPNPLIFERTAQRLDVYPDECLFIDDIAENCAGAESVGMQTMQFKDIRSIKQLLQ